jgi:uncharacterized protein YodC (DUF2158 family)
VKTGDIVRLKSGGPKMTVERTISQTDYVEVDCAWFDGGPLQHGRFRPEMLTPAKEKE